MTARKRASWKPMLLLLGAFALGCGKQETKLVPVEGRVTFGKSSLKTGFVIFYPDAARGNNSKEEPRGDVDKDGHYKIFTGVKEGAAPGWYKVAVTAADQIDPNNPYFTHWLIPEKYIDPKTSKLALEVAESPSLGAYDIHLDAK